MPLLLALHGRLGDGKGMATLTHLSQVADQYGFIVVYPDGYQRGWADGRGATTADQAGVDDVAFLSTLIATLSGEYAIDARRIYATGISNGGFMASASAVTSRPEDCRHCRGRRDFPCRSRGSLLAVASHAGAADEWYRRSARAV